MIVVENKISKLIILSFLILVLSCSKDGGVDEPLDTEKPSINCQANINITISSTDNETEVTYNAPTFSDNIGAELIQIDGLASGETFPLGTTTNTFQAKDEAGNIATCSFDVIVTRDVPSASLPYFIGTNPTPFNKKWTKVENMSDEFEGTTFDDTKWHRNPSTDGFNWIGRPPALFESDNVSVANGNLNITVEKFTSPKTVNNKDWTYGGAIVRSKNKAKHGRYYECKMQANKTVMSSTFWIAFQSNCNTGPVRKLELDIQECVGRVHSGTAGWAENFSNIYASNTWRHARSCDPGATDSEQSPGKTILDEQNNSRYFVYGCWWKSPTEIIFYLDGEFSHSITPTTDFDLEGHITMAIETYDWNPVTDSGSVFETGSVDDLTTKYDWVRTWELEDK